MEGLMASTRGDSFLIITVKRTGDFVQFTGHPAGVQLDFPVITMPQKILEPEFHDTAKKLGLTVVESKGSDGSRFLDIGIEGSPSEVAQVVSAFLAEFLQVRGDSDLEFKAEY